jgi:hypothetical protein
VVRLTSLSTFDAVNDNRRTPIWLSSDELRRHTYPLEVVEHAVCGDVWAQPRDWIGPPPEVPQDREHIAAGSTGKIARLLILAVGQNDVQGD